MKPQEIEKLFEGAPDRAKGYLPESATHYACWVDGDYVARIGKRLVWKYDGSIGSYWAKVIPRPVKAPSWNGEGLPPVGVECEAAIPHTSGPDNERSIIWIEGRVIAYHEIKGKTYAWFAEDDGFYTPSVLEFRLIRTPEQIAAEEREAAIVELKQHLCKDSAGIAAGIFDTMARLGYRKP